MPMHIRLVLSALLLFAGLSLAETPAADTRTSAQILASMKARLDAVSQLKTAKTVGENNLGLLTVLDQQAAGEQGAKLVAAENADRTALYQRLAAERQVAVELVGKLRAGQIATDSAPGIMIQDADGKWLEKPVPQQP